MSTSTVHARALSGIEAPAVAVETHIRGGLPGFSIVGLPEAAVREARDRVKSAILNSGFDFPKIRVTVNLAPADIPKHGGRFDLAIAVGILVASGQLPDTQLSQLEVLGELGLTGQVRSVRGCLSAAIDAAECSRKLIVPQQNFQEASLLSRSQVYGVKHLLEVCQLIRQPLPKTDETVSSTLKNKPVHRSVPEDCRLNNVKGQFAAKRGLVIAAAGAHHLLMSGPPGCGKTMLANRIQYLLPQPTERETAAMIKIHSAAGFSDLSNLFYERPFRNPHHSASRAAMAGGGNPVCPGEISLAHFGVLFLDELPEFNRQVIESLREPLESKEVMIARANTRVKYPAAFQLIAAMNPCPVGRNCTELSCSCSPQQKFRYRSRVSAPVLDRIDIHVKVNEILESELLGPSPDEDEDKIRSNIATARSIQYERNAGPLNSELSITQLEQFCHLDSSTETLMREGMAHFKLSARACHRLLKVSRTIADLDQKQSIETKHLSEAMSYRDPTLEI